MFGTLYCLTNIHLKVGEQDLIEAIVTGSLGCFRLRRFTESRWLTIGTSTRVLTVSVLLGLDGLFDYLKKDWGGVVGRGSWLDRLGELFSRLQITNCSISFMLRSNESTCESNSPHLSRSCIQDSGVKSYYLNGFSRFHPRARAFAVASAIASRVHEGFQSELMEDRRVASHYQELWEVASKELRWVLDIPDHLWSAFASVAGCRVDELKDTCTHAAHLSYHFTWRRVLQPAGQLPWRLCRGDLDANLRELGEMAVAPEEPCSHQLWHLIQHGHNQAQLRGVLRLLGQCSWSSLPAEQQHGSLSLLHRWHPEYGLESLVCRALLHQAVRMLPSESNFGEGTGAGGDTVEQVGE